MSHSFPGFDALPAGPGLITLPVNRGSNTSRGFSVHTTGGPTSINLVWESVLASHAHLRHAQAVLTGQRELLTTCLGTVFTSSVNWRVPAFLTKLGSLATFVAMTEQGLDVTLNYVQNSYDSYRWAEEQARTWIELIRRTSPLAQSESWRQMMQGNPHYAHEYNFSSSMMAGGILGTILSQRFPITAALIGLIEIYNRHGGVPPAAMGRNQQVLIDEEVEQLSFTADGSFHTYFDHMAQVAEHGDLAISTIENGDSEPLYAVHLPGFAPGDHIADGELDLSAGRGSMSLMDAMTHDSEHMAEVVLQALEQAGVPEGAELVLTGYSMGGMHVLNLLNHPGIKDRYRIRSGTTMATPGRDQQVNPDVPVVQFHDRNDPVHYVGGERNGSAANRLNVIYDYVNPNMPTPGQGEQEAIIDQLREFEGEYADFLMDHGPYINHSYGHNTEAIGQFEEQSFDDLSPAEQEFLHGIRQDFHGKITTEVYSTTWEPRQDPDHLFPWEWQKPEDAEYLYRIHEETRRPPGLR